MGEVKEERSGKEKENKKYWGVVMCGRLCIVRCGCGIHDEYDICV